VTITPGGLVRHQLCPVDDVAVGQMRSFAIGSRAILLIRRKDGAFRALSNECTHGEAALDEGDLLVDECLIECPLHGGRFDFDTGEAVEEPAEIPLAVYTVEVVDDVIHVLL
jgi:nitrite reductase/ring-hydroxylating ferredoxin subunit